MAEIARHPLTSTRRARRSSRPTEGRSRKQKKSHKASNPICSIPTRARALNSFSQPTQILGNFYKWVNEPWLEEASIPPSETDFGVSEEVEECVYKKSKELLLALRNKPVNKPVEQFFQKIINSCLDTRAQQNSVTFLEHILKTLYCVNTKEQIVEHFAELSKYRFPSILNFQYYIDADKKVQLVIEPNASSLPLSFLHNREVFTKYKDFLHRLGEKFEIENFEKVAVFEKELAYKSDSMWTEQATRVRGSTLCHKFPKFPWATWFETHGIADWKKHVFYYRGPRWLRSLGKMLEEIPAEYWKLYLARAYIMNALPYLPPPFDEMDYEFFGKYLLGQKEKEPQERLLVNTVYSYCTDSFSKYFWEHAGEKDLPEKVLSMTKQLVRAAKHRLAHTEWLQRSTRIAAIEKVEAMDIEVVRPRQWAPLPAKFPELDEKNFLLNVFLLGKMNTETMFHRAGHEYRYWEEGVYRVNAYYFNNNNEIIIPYGTALQPFYSSSASPAWNFGGLGCIIGHEMTHAFDEDGKEYDARGQKKIWWTRKDNNQYRYKSKALIRLFSKQKINGHSLDGKNTLSENIADLGGVGIALHALKEDMKKRGVVQPEEILHEYREFFISFATSWRTLYRKEKLEKMILLDKHSPAEFRVNLICSQFEEWYDAFGLDKPEKEFIRIF